LPNPNDEWGQSIWQIPGGFISLLFAYGEDAANEHIWLYRLDNAGDLIWKKVYAQSDTAILDAFSVRMYLTYDFHFIINGYCWYPDPGSPWPKMLRPFIIKTDSTGYLEWELPWSAVNNESFHGESYNSVTDNQGTVYSAARHIDYAVTPPGDKPCLIITDHNGNEIGYTNFFQQSIMGTTHTINWLADSTIALGYGWTDTISSDANIGVLKCDRFGNILKTKPLFSNQFLFSDAVTTHDNKLLMVGGFWDGIWRSHAYKLNSNLEYDSVYSQPLVYDSLCPHPIPSDTIPLGCVLVGAEELTEEPEHTEMVVYPNPVSGILHVVLPRQLKTSEKSTLFNITTFRSQWKSVDLEVYNLFGERVFSRQVGFVEKEITLEASNWQKGMYVIRLVYNAKTVNTVKVIKN
jgi:hypothetical protein